MPRWTRQEYEDYQARRKESAAIVERGARHEPLAARPAAETNPPGRVARVRVRVVSFRKRLLDPDNLCAKYHIDGLRYCHIIADDTARHITIEVSQEKVKTKAEERTEIEIVIP